MERARRIFIVSGAEYFFPPPVEKGIADGFKSYAASFILQDKDKTLNDKQVKSSIYFSAASKKAPAGRLSGADIRDCFLC